jgi:uncharacterized protein (DUF1697 family)
MTTFVSLLRGINVGGHHQVPMAELQALSKALGYKQVITYGHAGNVVFTCEETDPTQLAKRLEKGFAQQFGFAVTILVRTAEQFHQMVCNSPFASQPEKESQWILVLFLTTRPTSTALQALQETHAGPEEIHLMGQEMYLYYPQGIGRSKLSPAFLEKKLQTTGTGRNWNTILQLQKRL